MILVTGTSGFIGQHLLKSLIQKYGSQNVIALTSKPTQACNFILHNDYSFAKDTFSKPPFSEVDIVIHAGAFIPKKASEADDKDRSFSNIEGTLHLLNALPSAVKHFIFLSTVDVYSVANEISEETPVLPGSMYGHSKYYCERMIAAWAKKNDKQSVILRIGHVYGPGEEMYEKIIPLTIKKLLNKTSPQIWGTGEEKRSFIHVKDVVQAIINSIDLTTDNGPFNIVTNHSVTIKELVAKLIAINGLSLPIEFVNTNNKGRNLVFNNSKMQSVLCKESVSLDEGLKEEWNYMAALHNK